VRAKCRMYACKIAGCVRKHRYAYCDAACLFFLFEFAFALICLRRSSEAPGFAPRLRVWCACIYSFAGVRVPIGGGSRVRIVCVCNCVYVGGAMCGHSRPISLTASIYRLATLLTGRLLGWHGRLRACMVHGCCVRARLREYCALQDGAACLQIVRACKFCLLSGKVFACSSTSIWSVSSTSTPSRQADK
jgi:hypothetical protein